MNNHSRHFPNFSFVFRFLFARSLLAQDAPHTLQLPNGKVLTDVPGNPRPTSYTSGEKQSLSVLNLETEELTRLSG